MNTNRLFEVLEQRGQKQRWLLSMLREHGYAVSESYLSQIKSGVKQPNPEFIRAVCAVLGMPQASLFPPEGGKSEMVKKSASSDRRRRELRLVAGAGSPIL
jgi:transcriptional regulator with XRE-family HTH domain